MLKLSKYCKRNCSVSNGPVVGYHERPQDHMVFAIPALLGYHVSAGGAQWSAALLCASRVGSKGRLGRRCPDSVRFGRGVAKNSVIVQSQQQRSCRQSPRDAEEEEEVVVALEEGPCRLWHL